MTRTHKDEWTRAQVTEILRARPLREVAAAAATSPPTVKAFLGGADVMPHIYARLRHVAIGYALGVYHSRPQGGGDE